MKLDVKPYEEKMKKSISVYKEQLETVRAGRANPGVLRGIDVDYYGTPTAINQMAEVKLADARTLTITPGMLPQLSQSRRLSSQATSASLPSPTVRQSAFPSPSPQVREERK